MSATVVSAEAPTADAPAAAHARTRLATPPEWLWPVSILLQVASAAALTAYTYFFLDDWLFIAQARRMPFSISYLRAGLFEHFSPVVRLLDKLLVYNSTGSFALAHSLELAMYAAAIAAFAFVARTILGNRWSAFVLTVLFGQSLFLLRLLNWWTATANILPATICGLLAFGAYLRWRRAHATPWLIVSLGAFLVSLLDYETAMLLPFYLLAVRLLVLEDDWGPRAWIRAVRGEWVMWVGYLVLEAAAIVNFYSSYYHASPRPGLSRVLDFLVDSVLGTFIPALFGVKHTEAALGRQSLVVVACIIALLALVAYIVYTRPRAWRCVLAFALIAPVTMLTVGIPRLAGYSVKAVGTELYYQQPVQFMFLILAALAVGAARRRPTPRSVARLRAPIPATALIATVAAGYGLLFVTSVHAMSNSLRGSIFDPRRSHAYVRTFRTSVRRNADTTGKEPVLFNARVFVGGNGDWDSYAVFFGMIESRVRFNTVTNPMYAVRQSGALEAVQFHERSGGVLGRATLAPAGRPASIRAGEACVPTSPRAVQLRVPLTRPARLSLSNAVIKGAQLPVAMRLFIRMPAAGPVSVASQGRFSEQVDYIFPPTFARGLTGQYVPLDINADALAIDLWLPGGACVSSLVVGTFSPSSP